VLEHLTRDCAVGLLAECHRALRPGGTLRLVVPDLEAIVRHYLRLLESADAGAAEAQSDYDWILLELFDQMVRTESGGDMHRILASVDVRERKFVKERMGLKGEPAVADGHGQESPVRPGLDHYWRRIREEATASFAQLLMGRGARAAVREGLFRASGQVHLWMYDRFSLRRLFERNGFVDVIKCTAIESRIPEFAQYQLDTAGERVRKPDSLFMEGRKR
jgi:SAM-dependent methyltransferase